MVPAMRLAFALVLVAGCSRAEPPPAPVDPDAELRESARETLGKNCGECHTRGLPTALPRALAVFDLDEPDWSHRMTADQLREAQRRLDEPTAPALDENVRREIHL